MTDDVGASWAPVEWLLTQNGEFITSAIVALCVIAVWGYRRFDEPTFEPAEDEPILMLRPSMLATPREYLRGLVAYVLTLMGGYGVAVLLGPSLLKVLGAPDTIQVQAVQSPGVFPLLLVLALTGVGPSIPGIRDVEDGIRSFGHRVAGIPRGIQILAQRLGAAGFSPQVYVEALRDIERGASRWSNIAPLSFVTQDDLARDGGPLHQWARLCCLTWSLRETVLGNRRFLGPTRTQFDGKLAALLREIELVQPNVEAFRRTAAAEPAARMSQTLRHQIESLQRQAVALTVVAVVHEHQREEEIGRALAEIGFTIPEQSGDVDLSNIAVKTVAALGVAMLVLGVGWFFFIDAERMSIREVAPGVPHNLPMIVMWCMSMIVQTASAALLALYFRSWRIGRQKWRGRAWDYFFITAAAAFVTLLLVMVTDIVMKALTGLGGQASVWQLVEQTAFRQYLPFTVPMMATALFVLLALRHGPSRSVRRRALEAIVPAVTLAVIAAVTVTILNEQQAASQGPAADGGDLLDRYRRWSVMFSSLLALTSGAIIGLIVPSGYWTEILREDDSHAAGEAQRLRQEVRPLLGAAAERWLTSPNQALRGLAPVEAVRYRVMQRRLDRLVERLARTAPNGEADPARSAVPDGRPAVRIVRAT